MDFKQEDYYNIEAIEARLSQTLGSDVWNGLRQTDLGSALIKVGANIIHTDAMAFFTGLNQFFKSTVTLPGYLEEIAKSNGVIPKTYISANLTISIVSKINQRTFQPLDLCISVGGYRFYNITDVTIPTTEPISITLYEGSVIREASIAGSVHGTTWSYSKYKAVLSEKLGDRVVRNYLLLPYNTFADSIMVESAISYDNPFLRWGKIDTWFGAKPTSRYWKLGKDFLGRYKVEFGDGIYGLAYPNTEIVGLRYLISTGSGVEIDNYTDYILYSQDSNIITSDFIVGGISNVVDGASEVNTYDLHLEIEGKQTSRESLVSESDYKNYLESRSDVLYASVQSERKNNPPNIEFFNRVGYSIKTNTEGGFFNNSDIQLNLAKRGLDTVEFFNIDVKKRKFNIKIDYSVLIGYLSATVQSLIESSINSEFSWSSLDFDEVISQERVYSLLSNTEGLNINNLDITVEYVFTNDTTGATEFTFIVGQIVPLRFYPRRYRMYIDSDAFVSGIIARDNGVGLLYGDFKDTERFPYDGTVTCCTEFNSLILLGGGSTSLNLIDTRKVKGGISRVTFQNTVLFSSWCDRYNEIVTLELNTNYYLRSYMFPVSFFDMEGLSYIQLKDVYTYSTAKKSLQLTPPAGYTVPTAITYFEGYIYVTWRNSGSTSNVLTRYRIMSGSIEAMDAAYAGDGTLSLAQNGRTVHSMVGISGIFNGSSVLFLATATGGLSLSNMDLVVDFDIQDAAYYESDFLGTVFDGSFALPVTFTHLSTDGASIYFVANGNSEDQNVWKLYSIQSDGTAFLKRLSDTDVVSLSACAYSTYNSIGKVYVYSSNEFKLYSCLSDIENQTLAVRAGTVEGNVLSIQKILDIDYDTLEATFVKEVEGTLRWNSEYELAFEKEELCMLNELSVTLK